VPVKWKLTSRQADVMLLLDKMAAKQAKHGEHPLDNSWTRGAAPP